MRIPYGGLHSHVSSAARDQQFTDIVCSQDQIQRGSIERTDPVLCQDGFSTRWRDQRVELG